MDNKPGISTQDRIISLSDPILVTGAAGFIGSRVVKTLLDCGFQNLRCLVRPTSNLKRLEQAIKGSSTETIPQVIKGNLLSREDCMEMSLGVGVIYHLAAGTGTKSFADAFMNSVVTTRNLLDATVQQKCLKRLVNLSSFAVYTNRDNPHGRQLDETCPIEPDPGTRGEAYCFAKVKQDELVVEYGKKHNLPYVQLRPGVVYGPGKYSISGRIGVDTFGFFMHLGGLNRIPFTFVDNCAEAIVLAGLVKGVDGEVFNIVDDDLPSSRAFLRLYKKNVRRFRSVYVPHALSYLFCLLWEKYCQLSHDQLPPIFTRREWAAGWKRTRYTNAKLKTRLGWSPRVPMAEGLQLFFQSCRDRQKHA